MGIKPPPLLLGLFCVEFEATEEKKRGSRWREEREERN